MFRIKLLSGTFKALQMRLFGSQFFFLNYMHGLLTFSRLESVIMAIS
jgi:hypothetical protein